MKALVSRLMVLLALGFCAGLLAAFLASPRFWSAKRVETEAASLIEKGEFARASDLYRIGARSQKMRRIRDDLFLKGCDAVWESGDYEKTKAACCEAAEGPKRMAQAKALLVVAEAYLKNGERADAMRIYHDLAARYWDYRQGRLAKTLLSQLELERLFDLETPVEKQKEIGKFVKENVTHDFSNALVRKAVVLSLTTALREGSDFPTGVYEKIKKGMSSDGGGKLILRLGALSKIDPAGERLKKALSKNGIPVKDRPEDIIRLAYSDNDASDEREKIIAYLAARESPKNLDQLIRSSTDAGVRLRCDIARRWLEENRYDDARRLLEKIAASDKSGIGYAQADFLMAQSEKALGQKKKAARRFADIVERGPRYPDLAVRAAREASQLYLEIGKVAEAKKVLESAAKIAAGADRLDLTRAAMEIEL